MMGLPGQLPGAVVPAVASNAPEAAPDPAPAPADAPAAKPRGFTQKTMLGMTSPFMAGPPQPLHGKPGAAAPATSSTGAPAVPTFGPPSPVVAAAAAAAATRGEPVASAGPSTKHTMLGVAPPAALAAALQAAQAARSATAAPAEAAPPSPAPAAPALAPPAPDAPAGDFASKPLPPRAPEAKRTMVGVAPAAPPPPPAPSSDASSVGISSTLPPPPAAPAAPENKVAAQTDRTMLGMAMSAPTESAPEAPPSYGSGERSFTTPVDADHSARRESTQPEPPSTARALLAALAGALLVLALGLAAWHFFSGSDVVVQVVQGDEGEALQVEVPSAEPGAKVRFLGVEKELAGGIAKFPLAADALALGDNELSIGVVRGGEVKPTSVSLHVAYRARVELAGLSSDPPTLDVVIDALPGSQVKVDGQAVALDARGRGSKKYPVGAQSGTKLAFAARYDIEPPEGARAEGTLTLNLPVSSLQIDRPGAHVTTDQATIEVAGAVENLAQVTVDGQTVKVLEGRFSHKVKLPSVGEHTLHVLARVPGKAPRAVDVSVTRVADLTLAAASFKPDTSLSYGKIAQNPVMYRGQKVAFDGRVYNVEVKGSASHLQMLVRDCPGSQRCPLWVELPQATDVTMNAWVRVLGTVAGEQQFRSERNQVHTVPSVTAQYVLKLAR